MTNHEFETLKKFIASNDIGLMDLAKEMVNNDNFDFDEMVLLCIYARNQEQEKFGKFKQDINNMDAKDIEAFEDFYCSLAYLIAILQKKIKAHVKYEGYRRVGENVVEQSGGDSITWHKLG